MKEFLKRIASNRIVFIALVVILFMALLDFFIRGYDVIQERYGINVMTFAYVFITAEVFFNLGIYLMLRGIGIFKVHWRDLIRFKFSNVNVNNPLTYYGFLMNRVAAVAPWAYVLAVGARHLPWPVILAILGEFSVVAYIGSQVKIEHRPSIFSKFTKSTATHEKW